MADSVVKSAAGDLSVRAYRGDAKTLLAFDLPAARSAKLAGFTIFCKPHGQPGYYIENSLRYKSVAGHAQVPAESPNSTVNAPLHKFRWVHVPDAPPGAEPFLGSYTYTVTPRFVDAHRKLVALDPALGVSLDVEVGALSTGKLEVAFTRGYVQSQAFVNRYGATTHFRPRDKVLLFETGDPAGTDPSGNPYTYAAEYAWMGFTARKAIFAVLNEVLGDPAARLDVFAYDLDEPDICRILLELAGQGRLRVILDNSSLHTTAAGKPTELEDQFEQQFRAVATAGSAILRGRFGRYAHDKILLVSGAAGPSKVLTGSTNFAVNGLYVNSNHVLVFSDDATPKVYADLFETAWAGGAKRAAFVTTGLSTEPTELAPVGIPATSITFAPHAKSEAERILGAMAARVAAEGAKAEGGNVMFAVMQTTGSDSAIYTELNQIHADATVFSYGVSDSPDGIWLYEPGKTTGVLVTGKPAGTRLPPPFSQVPGIGTDHQIHHKFVVCGFRSDDAVVYCGSSNLATGGEQLNGDNLLEIHDQDVATAFAIEAVLLVDHFQFLDRYSTAAGEPAPTPPADQQTAAAEAGWHLATGAGWATKYFAPTDLYCVDRQLFA